jgi:iron complex outermembrane receptor protein
MRQIKKSLLVIAMLVGAPVFGANQPIVLPEGKVPLMGRVTDEEGLPIEGAILFVAETNQSVVSTKEGVFRLAVIRRQPLTVSCSHVGYQKALRTVMPGNRDTLEIRLKIAYTETEEIVVTGGRPSTQHENAVQIEVLRPGALDAVATPNLCEALASIPGVDRISKGNGVAKPVIRGLSMSNVLVLDNGTRYENYQYSSHHPLGIDEYGIEQVEVIKGPASLLYGSDAIGGVLNVIRERPAPQHHWLADCDLKVFSNSLGASSSLGWRAAGEHLYGGIRMSQSTHADYLQGGGGWLGNSRFNEQSLSANGGLFHQRGSVDVSYDYRNQRLGLVEEEALAAIDRRGRTCDLFYQTLQTHLLSVKNTLYLGRTRWEGNASLQRTELVHFGDPGVYELQMGLRTWNLTSKLYMPTSETGHAVLGVEGMHQSNENLHQRETILLPNATIDNASVFGFYQQSFQRMEWQGGVRFDLKHLVSESVGDPLDLAHYRPHLDKHYANFSGSIGLTYHPSSTLLLRANLASAYRTPNLAELTSNGQHEAIYEKGDAGLKPERTLEWDGGLHWHLPYLTVEGSVFLNRIADYLFQSPTGTYSTEGLPIYLYRQDDATLYGSEWGVHLHPVSCPWLHLKTTYATVRGVRDDGQNLPFVPAPKCRMEIRVEKTVSSRLKQVHAGVSFLQAFRQNHPAPEETSTGAYRLLDVVLGGILSVNTLPVECSLTVSNLFDTRYVDHLSTLKEVGGYQPGRNVIFSVHVPLGGGK